jgi:hypothetical protein
MPSELLLLPYIYIHRYNVYARNRRCVRLVFASESWDCVSAMSYDSSELSHCLWFPYHSAFFWYRKVGVLFILAPWQYETLTINYRYLFHSFKKSKTHRVSREVAYSFLGSFLTLFSFLQSFSLFRSFLFYSHYSVYFRRFPKVVKSDY